MIQSKLSNLAFLALIFALFISCDTDDPYSFPPPDFSTVPEPYDISNIDPVDISEGVTAYTHDDGRGEFQVTLRDRVYVFLTLRSPSEEIIYSTYSSDQTSSVAVDMGVADGKDFSVYQTISRAPYGNTIAVAYTPGFREALLGMKEGEKTTLVISPEKAYKDIPQNSVNSQYTDSTLTYDIQISNITPAKRR